MADNKTRPTNANVEAFIEAVEPLQRREDARALLAMMERLSGEKPVLWGPSIIGFGSYRYMCGKREESMCRIGFSPRKAATVLYLADGYAGKEQQLARLGKHTTGASCVYIKKLGEVDMGVLEDMVRSSLAYMDEKYPA